jgi:hypothetical protein
MKGETALVKGLSYVAVVVGLAVKNIGSSREKGGFPPLWV